MQCPKCNTDNREDARFCLTCGASLTVACPQCGRELPPRAQFCDACGAQLGAPEAAPPAAAPDAIAERLQRLVPREYAERLLATRGQVQHERRVVTILFSDVKGSTAMAEKLDPEDVIEIMRGAFDVLIEPVYRYEGTLARLMGDAILAFFGAPIAHEDDPERACRAALEITAGAAEYAEKLEKERGIKGFNVRVGINTGLVVVGEVGTDLRVEYTAMGDAINLAARMESAAEPGTVLITEATHKLIAPLFETEALGPVQVKGKAEPVPVYRVLAAKAVPAKPRGIVGLESPLVGREAEFAALREALERLQAGVGGIVTIVGEAGIGKSRLVAEMGERSSPDIQWVEGRCLSYGTSIAYLLWLDVLRGLLGVTAEDASQTVRDRLRERVQALCPEHFDDVYPHIARLMSLRPELRKGLRLQAGYEAALPGLEGEKLRAATFQAVETLIQSAANDRPLVLVCEDLQWADPTSIELLERVLALTDRASLLLICILRPNPEHGSWGIRETAARQYRHRLTDLWLSPLSPGDSQMLVANLLEMSTLAGSFRERVLRHAEGNPFYVEEIIRSLINSGAIARDEGSGSWRAAQDLQDMPIPDTLQGVLLARIDRLPEDTRRVLQMASVIGRVFLYRVLEGIAEGERELDQHLLTLQREQMIRERARLPEPEYIFKHELTREAAYNGLLKVQRRLFHRQVAEALERLFPDRIEEQVGLLAHHWERAGDAERAVDYLLRAGDQSLSIFALDEGLDAYQQAEQIAREHGWIEQLRHALEGSAEAYTSLGDNEEALASYKGALELADEDLERAHLYNQIGYVYYMHLNDRDQALAYYQRALAALGDATNTVEMGRISLNLGYLYLIGPGANHDEALQHLGQARRILEGSDQWADLALCHAYLAFVTRLDSPQDAIEHGQRALAICDRFGLDAPAEPAYMALGHAHRMLGDWEQATAFYEAGLDKHRITGYVMGAAIACYFLGLAYLVAGRIAEAIELGQESLAAAEKIGLQPYVWRAWAVLTAAHSLAGQAEQAAECMKQALAETDDGIRFQYALACVHAQLGQRDEALAILRRIAPQMDDGLQAWALRDPDLLSLRDDAQFRCLVDPG